WLLKVQIPHGFTILTLNFSRIYQAFSTHFYEYPKLLSVRGRTDGKRYTPSDENIALNRALSAKRYLVRNGASPLMIFINYYSGGDYIADNNSPGGRHQNRRVELEFMDYAIPRQPTLP
ncbi:MAG: OmpA family protein, partial [Methyloglobulus sp.]